MAKVSIRALRRDCDLANELAMRTRAELDGANHALNGARSEIARCRRLMDYMDKLTEDQAQYIRALRETLKLSFQIGSKIYEGRYE